MKYDPRFILQRNIKNLFSVNGTLEDEQMFELISRLKSDASDAASNALAFSTELNELMTDELLDRLGLENGYTPEQFHASMKVLFNERNALRESHSMIATALQIDSTKSSGILKAIANVKALLAQPDATQPQLSEIRYVLHGDIQPCSVLYSDDTTTLLRLDEGDVMCETDTIEWSDSVTYRCQELLKSAADPVHIAVPLKTSKLFAQLVRDERILLNDNGDDDVETETRDVEAPCGDCGHVFDAQSMTCPMCMTIRSSEHPTAVVPAPPPMPHQKPDHNNPYIHTNAMFTEEAMRRHGWTNEALVSCGHGHYAPTQYPADMER